MNSKVWSQPTLYVFPPTVLFFTVSSQVKFPLVGEDKRRKAARGLGGLGVGMTTESWSMLRWWKPERFQVFVGVVQHGWGRRCWGVGTLVTRDWAAGGGEEVGTGADSECPQRGTCSVCCVLGYWRLRAGSYVIVSSKRRSKPLPAWKRLIFLYKKSTIINK